MNVHQTGDQIFVCAVYDPRVLTPVVAEFPSSYLGDVVRVNQYAGLFYRLTTGPVYQDDVFDNKARGRSICNTGKKYEESSDKPVHVFAPGKRIPEYVILKTHYNVYYILKFTLGAR